MGQEPAAKREFGTGLQKRCFYEISELQTGRSRASWNV
ncbi:hypothetical protein EMEDMD4_490105 [Sinorhizobium medicae]|uniref:Uncharacterized protein n=1 Tax=Sinorhizobium medicae TaxID=110321 RepID=A0A508X046_9HYPH|nr:hypothetical protein EMEDMD4_490105 [Sinorhizobium medicae]